MHRKIIPVILFLVSVSGFGQQLPQFTQYMNANQYVNPSMTGANLELSGGLLARQQWAGLKDSSSFYPQTYMLLLESPLQEVNSGIGIVGFYDRAGYDRTIYLRLNYAYHFKIPGENLFSIGVSADYQSQKTDLGDYGYSNFSNQYGEQKKGALDFGLGIHFRSSAGIYTGLSAQNLLQSKLDFGEFSQLNSTLYQFIAGAVINLKDTKYSKIDLMPSILIKTSGFVPAQYDLDLLVLFNDKFYGGIMYRYKDAVGPIAGIVLKNVKVGVSYDYTTSSLRPAGSMGSFEIFVAYRRSVEPLIRWRSLYNTKDL